MRKESITRTKDQEKAIVNFILSKGFKNISRFASAVGMERQNVWARIKGKTNPDITMLMFWAITLDCEVDNLIALFYPSEWECYRVCVPIKANSK